MNDKMSVLEKLAPELNPRYTITDVGNSNLFADSYRDIARYVPERKMWHIFTGKMWEPDIGNLQAIELCKRLADELVIYALSLPDGRERDEYRRAVERWQIRHYREIILKDAMGIYPAKLSEFDRKPYLLTVKTARWIYIPECSMSTIQPICWRRFRA